MQNNKGSFWPSYVDVMTTLFAIMLVLFVVSFSRFKIKNDQLQELVDEYEDIITVYSTVGSIDSTCYFGYNAEYLKHLFTIDVEYQDKEYSINKLKMDITNPVGANEKRDSIINAGLVIKNTILKLESNNAMQDNIKFLVVIEGQSSRIKFNIDDWRNNYTLSYLRAQFLNEFWKTNGINLASISKCELIISGSGEAGVPRVLPDEEVLRRQTDNEKEYWDLWKRIEGRNQRFLIHIFPIIGNINVTKAKIQKIRNK